MGGYDLRPTIEVSEVKFPALSRAETPASDCRSSRPLLLPSSFARCAESVLARQTDSGPGEVSARRPPTCIGRAARLSTS